MSKGREEYEMKVNLIHTQMDHRQTDVTIIIIDWTSFNTNANA